MKKLIGIALFGFLFMSSLVASAAEQTYHINGEQLLSYCKDTMAMMQGSKDYNVSKSSWCIGFIQGSVTAHRFYSTYYTLQKPEHRNLPDIELEKKINDEQVYCIPASVTLGQIVQSVTTTLQNNPKLQQQPASIAVARALNQTYPCK